MRARLASPHFRVKQGRAVPMPITRASLVQCRLSTRVEVPAATPPPSPMIVFVTTAPFAYTHEKVLGADPALRIEMWPYARLETTKVFPRATYILTDHDRLAVPVGRWAHAACERMRADGSIALNDPVRVLTRAGLLRALYLAGINGFNAYRVEERVRPERWPVFLRCEGDHLGPISGLLHG